MQLSVVSKTIGILLMVFSFTQIPPILIDFISGEGQEFVTFLLSFGLTLMGGFFMWYPFMSIKQDFRLREGVLIVVCFWVVLSLFATLPFMLTDAIPDLSFRVPFSSPCLD